MCSESWLFGFHDKKEKKIGYKIWSKIMTKIDTQILKALVLYLGFKVDNHRLDF